MCCTSFPKPCHGGWELEYIHPNYNISSFVFNLLGQTAPLLLFMICLSCKSPAEVIALNLSWFSLRNAWINSTVNVERSRGGELRAGNRTICYQCTREVMVGSRQQLSSSPLEAETPFWPIFLMTNEILSLRNGWFKDQWYLWTRSCSCIRILEVRAALFPPRNPSASQTSQIYYLWWFCLGSWSNHRYCSNEVKSW